MKNTSEITTEILSEKSMKVHQKSNENYKKKRSKNQQEKHQEFIRKLCQKTQISAQVLQ